MYVVTFWPCLFGGFGRRADETARFLFAYTAVCIYATTGVDQQGCLAALTAVSLYIMHKDGHVTCSIGACFNTTHTCASDWFDV